MDSFVQNRVFFWETRRARQAYTKFFFYRPDTVGCASYWVEITYPLVAGLPDRLTASHGSPCS